MSLMRSKFISGKKKGQFFIIAALLFSVIFYLGVSVKFSESVITKSSNLKYLYNNIEREYRHVFNLGLDGSNEIETLMDFTLFVKNITKERNIDFESFIVFTKNTSSNISVTIINYFENDVNITINISDEIKNAFVPIGSYTTLSFSPQEDEFTMKMTFNNIEKELLLEKYKVNLYFILSLGRGDDVIKGDFLA